MYINFYPNKIIASHNVLWDSTSCFKYDEHHRSIFMLFSDGSVEGIDASMSRLGIDLVFSDNIHFNTTWVRKFKSEEDEAFFILKYGHITEDRIFDR
jgi:hypothetical protein